MDIKTITLSVQVILIKARRAVFIEIVGAIGVGCWRNFIEAGGKCSL